MMSSPRHAHTPAPRWLVLTQIPVLALALAACGDDGGGTEGDGLSSSSGTGGQGASTSSSGTGGAGATTTTTTTSSGTGGDNGYPPPPYGNEVDDTFPMLSWEGWLNPTADQLATEGTWGPVDSNSIRTSGDDYALVHLAADY